MSRKMFHEVDIVHTNGSVNCQPCLYRSRKEAEEAIKKAMRELLINDCAAVVYRHVTWEESKCHCVNSLKK